MEKRRVLAYLLLPLAVAGAVLYMDTPPKKPETNSSERPFAPENAAFENVQAAEKTSKHSEKGGTKSTRTEIAANDSEWKPPRFDERQHDRQRMVERQIAARGLGEKNKDYPEVLDAMRNVPRHLFVHKKHRASAYADRPLPIGEGQTISQPYVVALMTAYLNLEKSDKVLEIGTGSGYQAAVLSEMTPHVYSIEILDNLAETARKRLHNLGYKVVNVKNADGYYGWEEYAPFDGIIVTCAAGHIPPPLLDQLKPGGRMIIPVGGPLEVQQLTLVTKDNDGQTSTRSMMTVRFVPMTGQMQQ